MQNSVRPVLGGIYTIAEVAQSLRVHRVTVSRFVQRGELRTVRLGHRTVRITHEALTDFLRAQENRSAEQQ